jgi:fatty-acyl-CoA synthase/long-chain acyl-CoA synthetase
MNKMNDLSKQPGGAGATPPEYSEATYLDYHGEDPAKMRISVTTFGDLLLTAVDRYPDTTALIFPKNRKTYAEVGAAAMQRARGLWALGVRPGDHVGILLPTGTDFVEVFFAVTICGAIAVCMNARYQPSELAYVAKNADVKLMITTDAIADKVDFVGRINTAFTDLAGQTDAAALSLERAPLLKSIVLLGKSSPAGFVDEAAFNAGAERADEREVHLARIAVRVRDIGMMLYTSGTSSNPKGCLITHEAMVRNACNLGRHRWRYTRDDKVWSPLPLFHIAAMLPMLAMVDAGGTYIGMEYFDPGVGLKMIQEEGATEIFAPFVTFLQALLYHPDFDKTDLSGIKVMNSCFGVMPPSVGEAFRKVMPNTLQVGTFGMTEACGIVSTGSWDMDREMGFKRLGPPMMGVRVRIIDRETGEDLSTGQIGEVLIKGYSVFEGYYGDELKTAEALDADGWYHSGDIGSVDDNDHLMFHGRLKDMLKVGGENVAAAEVEAVLAQHPGVKLAQVVGIPDDRLAEVPAAFIELAPGGEASEAELIALCRREMASFKAPRHVRFVTEWPMSASKIQKYRLRDGLVKELGLD